MTSASPLAIVLGGGQGKRMASDLPKVLVPVCGRPMVEYVLEAVRQAGVDKVLVVVGYRAELVREALSGHPGVSFALQAQQLGTGHAVMMCRDRLAEHAGPVLVLAGDSPMVQVSSLKKLFVAFEEQRPACLMGTARKADPQGLGRILRDADGQFQTIIEERDTTPEQKAITEVNMSTYIFRPDALLRALEKLTAENAQGEYYLTDCPGILKEAGELVVAIPALEECESLSINTVDELARVEEEMKRRLEERTR